MQLTAEHLVARIKDRLLPLNPWLNALEWLIERLPRKLVNLELKPNDHIEVINQAGGEYKATGNAPGFQMKFSQGEPRSGWYYLEAAIVRNTGNQQAGIRVEFMDNPGDSVTIPIPATLRGSVREVFFLPPDIRSLCWIPTTAQGFFSQSQLVLHRITRLESVFRRLYRVLYDLWRFRRTIDSSYSDISLLDLIFRLQVAYDRSAELRLARQSGDNYNAFIVYNDTLTVAGIRRIRRQIGRLSRKPLISIIMAMEHTHAVQFGQSIASLTDQLYDNWELLIAYAGDNDAPRPLSQMIGSSQRGRIRFITPETGGGTSIEPAILLNRALQEARGEWILQINPGDRLPLHALFHFVAEFNLYPDAQFIYGDDDQIDGGGQRSKPRFKPDWNPDLFHSCDYIGRPALYRRDRLVKAGGYAAGFAGAEGYELRLRYLSALQETGIRHVHKILYHMAESSSLAADAGTRHAAGRRALQQHLHGSGAEVQDGAYPLLYRITYPLPRPAPLVSIIIPTRDKADLLKACVDSVRSKTSYPNWEILIVDNNSRETETLAYLQTLEQEKDIRILPFREPFNFASINNYAAECARGEILLLLNNDIEAIEENWLTEMVSHAIRPGIGAVGAKLLYPDNTIQHAGVILGIGGVAAHAHRFLPGDAPGYCNRAVVAQNLSAVTGACLAVRKKLYQQVGGMDKKRFHVAYNDIDLCLKLLDAGYKNIFTPYAMLYHHESLTRGRDDTPEKKAVYHREYNHMKQIWGKKLISDRAYNRNLSLENEYFTPRI